MRDGRYLHYLSEMNRLLWTAIFLLTLHSVTYLMMPVVAKNMSNGFLHWKTAALGIVFWASIIWGYVLLAKANIYRKALVRKHKDEYLGLDVRVGVISFFSTIPGSIADFVVLVVVLGFLIVQFAGYANGYYTYVLLAILSLSLNMHGVFNGKIYKTAKYKRNVKRGKDNE